MENLYVYDESGNSISGNGYSNLNGGATSVASPSYEALVDQIKQNNAWSAEQAQKQMDFQERAWREQMKANADQAQINRDFQQESANQAMAFNSAEAQANREWQQIMSSTAHQREMKDLQAAGLNPILAANSGASSGSGSSAVGVASAGSQAASTSTPQGSKANTDESGTMAIMSLLGKMLDNELERDKMKLSAETNLSVADIYTQATRYASELSAAASRYGSNMSYAASQNNLEHILGNAINQLLEASGYNGYTAYGLGTEFFGNAEDFASDLSDRVKSIARTLDYIDTGGQGNKGPFSKGANIVKAIGYAGKEKFK